MTVLADLGPKVKCEIAKGEECDEKQFNKPGGFEIAKKGAKHDLVMDSSEMAEKGLRDMIEIDELNHATILYNLFKRYMKDQIYTYVGPTLLVVNPFKNVGNPLEVIKDYKAITESDDYNEAMKHLDPHVYAISALAHKQLMDNKNRQAIVISGESGAGKTENAK